MRGSRASASFYEASDRANVLSASGIALATEDRHGQVSSLPTFRGSRGGNELVYDNIRLATMDELKRSRYLRSIR